jgi:hypothetical protein
MDRVAKTLLAFPQSAAKNAETSPLPAPSYSLVHLPLVAKLQK